MTNEERIDLLETNVLRLIQEVTKLVDLVEKLENRIGRPR